MHNCRAFDVEAGTRATGSSGLSESSGEKGGPGRDRLSGPSLWAKGSGPGFPQRPLVGCWDVPVEQNKVPSGPL